MRRCLSYMEQWKPSLQRITKEEASLKFCALCARKMVVQWTFLRLMGKLTVNMRFIIIMLLFLFVARKVNEKMEKKRMEQRCMAIKVVGNGLWKDYMWPHQLDKTHEAHQSGIPFVVKGCHKKKKNLQI